MQVLEEEEEEEEEVVVMAVVLCVETHVVSMRHETRDMRHEYTVRATSIHVCKYAINTIQIK